MRGIDGEEKIPANGSLLTSLNKEGDWLYFSDDYDVYKINAESKGEKQLVYSFEKDNDVVSSILLNHGDVLVTSATNKSVYVREDGAVVELGKITSGGI